MDRDRDNESPAAVLYRELESEVRLPEHVNGESALVEVLAVLGQSIGGAAFAEIGESLPDALRIRVRDGAPLAREAERFGLDGFLERVAWRLGVGGNDARAISAGALALLHRWLPLRARQALSDTLAADLRALLPASETSATEPDRCAQHVLQRIEASGVLPAEAQAQDAFAAAMCTLCRRLSREEAADVCLALPEGVQAMLTTCALEDRLDPPEELDRERFLRQVGALMGVERELAEAITRTVFAAVEEVLPASDVVGIANQLPPELKDLWLDASPGARPAAA